MTKKVALQWLPCQPPDVTGSVLRLVGPVTVYWDCVTWKVWSAILSQCPTRRLQWPQRNRAQIMCNTSRAYHVQHVIRHGVRRDSSAFEIALNLTLFYLLKPLTDNGGQETGVPEENPRRRASEKATHKSREHSSPNRDENPHPIIGRRHNCL